MLARFALEAPLGTGGQGTVWRARDLVARRDVAVKAFHGLGAGELMAQRREVAALRVLRIPGIVTLLDAGVEHGVGYVAMELVEGVRFPGTAPREWSALAPLTHALLETLSRVHAAGIVHADLKPANVLVDPARGPVVMDLGIAGGAAFSGAQPLAGTLRYMAPLLFDGVHPSAATDLYSLAVMLFEVLVGAPPREGGAPALLQDPLEAIEVAAALDGHAPREVVQLLVQVLTGAGREPLDAEGWLRALEARGAAQRIVVEEGTELGALFDARDRVVGHRAFAVRMLAEAGRRGDGALDPARATRELARWLALGIGRVRSGRVQLHEDDIVRLERRRGARTAAAEAELSAAWRTTGLAELAERAFAQNATLFTRGELRAVLAELPTILGSCLHGGRVELAPEVLTRWLLAALLAADRGALELLLHEVERSDVTARIGAPVALLASAAVAALSGSFERAEVQLRGSGAAGSFELALVRHAVTVFVARQRRDLAAFAAALADARAFVDAAGHSVPELDGWAGWHAYHAGDYVRAEVLHRRVAASMQGPRRAMYLLDAGAAALERGEHDVASAAADEAQAALAGHRHPPAAGRVEWLRRAALYRADRAGEVDQELVEVIGEAGLPHVAALVTLTEAAVAWRRGERATAQSLAARAAELFTGAGLAGLGSLAAALALVAGAPEAPCGLGPEFSGLPPALALQCAELWQRAGCSLSPTLCVSLFESARRCGGLSVHARRELLSLSECRDLAPLPTP